MKRDLVQGILSSPKSIKSVDIILFCSIAFFAIYYLLKKNKTISSFGRDLRIQNEEKSDSDVSNIVWKFFEIYSFVCYTLQIPISADTNFIMYTYK